MMFTAVQHSSSIFVASFAAVGSYMGWGRDEEVQVIRKNLPS